MPELRISNRVPGVDGLKLIKHIKNERDTMDTVIVLGVVYALGYYCYKQGKSTGSRKGFGVGRFGRKGK